MQTLDICRERPNNFKCVAMAAGFYPYILYLYRISRSSGGNIDLLAKQIAEFRPLFVSIANPNQIDSLRQKLKDQGLSDGDMPEVLLNDSYISI
jgi:1-deoxy-D-xylulose 5-phosphate reductoisomerase